jgi:hypothetical protein
VEDLEEDLVDVVEVVDVAFEVAVVGDVAEERKKKNGFLSPS